MRKGLIAAALIVLANAALAGDAHRARELTPADIKFEDNPAFPEGAQSQLIHGDPTKPDFFIIRLRFPPNYVVPPHTHPAFESVTVLTGSMGSGMGEKVEKSKGKMLETGSLLLLPANHAHYVWTEDEETIIQVAATGPFDIIYVNSEDDPRIKK